MAWVNSIDDAAVSFAACPGGVIGGPFPRPLPEAGLTFFESSPSPLLLRPKRILQWVLIPNHGLLIPDSLPLKIMVALNLQRFFLMGGPGHRAFAHTGNSNNL